MTPYFPSKVLQMRPPFKTEKDWYSPCPVTGLRSVEDLEVVRTCLATGWKTPEGNRAVVRTRPAPRCSAGHVQDFAADWSPPWLRRLAARTLAGARRWDRIQGEARRAYRNIGHQGYTGRRLPAEGGDNEGRPERVLIGERGTEHKLESCGGGQPLESTYSVIS